MAEIARLDGPFAPETIVTPEANVAPRPPAPGGPGLDSRALALMAAEACDDRKAVDIRLIGVEAISSLADWFVICSGLSDVQVRAIARSVQDQLEEQTGRLPLRQEGQDHGRWVVCNLSVKIL